MHSHGSTTMMCTQRLSASTCQRTVSSIVSPHADRDIHAVAKDVVIETHFSSQCETTVIQINATERGEQKHRIRVRLSHSPDDCVDGYGDRLMPLNRIAVFEFLVGSTPHAQVISPNSNPKFTDRHQVIHQRRPPYRRDPLDHKNRHPHPTGARPNGVDVRHATGTIVSALPSV